MPDDEFFLPEEARCAVCDLRLRPPKGEFRHVICARKRDVTLTVHYECALRVHLFPDDLYRAARGERPGVN